MDVIRRTPFASDALAIGLFAVRPARHVTGTPRHAVLVAADTPYRVSFPGAIGDRALTYAMGHGQACMRVTIGGEAQPVLREFTRAA